MARARPRRGAPTALDRATTLAPPWQSWLVENLIAGVAPTALTDTLIGRGVPAADAHREVDAIATSPLLPVCGALATRVRRLELVAALARHHAAHEPDADRVERRRLPGADEFFRHYWAAQRPVVFTDVTRRWPALRKWTPAFFRRELGTARIEITAGRDADPDYDRNFAAHRRRLRMDRFIDEILAVGVSNDQYLVANNKTMERPRFRRLLGDVRVPDTLFEPLRAAATSLWIGPAGTVTPLHHDTTNILFCQLHGSKRFELVAPAESALLLDVDGFYSPVDLDTRATASPALRALRVKTVEVGPGDALFIPAGWWHRVTALAVSISFSLLGFRRPNAIAWYCPGDRSRQL